MKYDVYLQYILHTVGGYSQKNKRYLIELFVKSGLADKTDQMRIQGLENVCLSNLDVHEQLDSCLKAKNEAVKLFEKWEFEKDYKYSVIFDCKKGNKTIIDQISKKVESYKENADTFDILFNNIKDPIALENDELYLLKFNLKYEATHPITLKELLLKYPVIVVIYKNFDIVEIRFDSIKSAFIYDESKSIAFYSELIKNVRNYIEDYFSVKLENISLEPIYNLVKTNEDGNVKLKALDMRCANGGSAQLDVGQSQNYVLPILGELKNLILENKELFDDANNIKELLEQFINEKEETSEYPWIVLKWEDEVKTRSTEVKFIFNYMGKEYCLLQHHFNNAKVGMERMNNVTKYIAENRAYLQGELKI